jgi:hypothetical protein
MVAIIFLFIYFSSPPFSLFPLSLTFVSLSFFFLLDPQSNSHLLNETCLCSVEFIVQSKLKPWREIDIVTYFVYDYRWGIDWILDLLSTYAHHSELHIIITLTLISTLHKSPQYPLSLFQPAVSSRAVPWQRLLTVEILQLPALRSFCHNRPCRNPVNSLNPNWQQSTPELSVQFSASTANYLVVMSSQFFVDCRFSTESQLQSRLNHQLICPWTLVI